MSPCSLMAGGMPPAGPSISSPKPPNLVFSPLSTRETLLTRDGMTLLTSISGSEILALRSLSVINGSGSMRAKAPYIQLIGVRIPHIASKDSRTMSSNLGCYTTSISMAHPSWWTSCTDSGWEQQVFGQVSIPSPQMPGRAVHATMEMSRMSAMWCSTALRIHIFGSSLCSPTLFMFSPQTGFQLFSMSQSSIRLHVFLARSCGAEPPSRTLPRLKLLSSHVHVCLVPSRLVLCLYCACPPGGVVHFGVSSLSFCLPCVFLQSTFCRVGRPSCLVLFSSSCFPRAPFPSFPPSGSHALF